MLDLEGCHLSEEERDILCHPLVGGVVLFSRNFESIEQLSRLVADVHGLREPRLLIAVDQEGGRVQRFRNGFTRLPAPACFGQQYDEDPSRALRLAESFGWVLAAELRSIGLDFSFAPVLDLARHSEGAIGDRAFHRDPQVVAELARSYMRGASRAGMAVVGKHFPGHGSVTGDSHLALPVDRRSWATLMEADLLTFERMIHYGLPAIMTAHLRFPAVDPEVVTFSLRWLREILRGQLGFKGALFSDDLGMAAAAEAGDVTQRIDAALAAACDMTLICNNRDGVIRALNELNRAPDALSHARLVRMHGKKGRSREALEKDPIYQRAALGVAAVERTPELDLGEG